MHNKQFKNLLDKAYSKINATNKPVIIRYTKPVFHSINDILDIIPIKKDVFYMNFPNNENSYIGIGKSISHIISSRKELINLKRNKYVTINNDTKDTLTFFGGVAFNMDAKGSFPWKNIPRGEFFIPKLLIQNKESQTSLTYTRSISKNISKESVIKDYKHHCLLLDKKIEHQKKNIKTKIHLKSQSPGYRTYVKNVQNIINSISDKSLTKVVISRLVKYSLSKKISIINLISYLNKKYPKCLNFFICFNKNNIFMGSTPEKLVQIYNTSFSSDAIAGSCSNKQDIYNTKEINEHNYVVEHIKNKMEIISSNINIPKNPSTLKLDYIYHLYTSITGILKKKTHILELIAKLYPTPALLGNPSKKANSIIDLYESTDRGWYGGCIGMYNDIGDGKFYVPIRSGLIKNNYLLLFTGSGIVSESDSHKEWEETSLKLEHILSYFKG